MEHQQFCQSCGMPLDVGNRGTNVDGSRNDDYCVYCYKEGKRWREDNGCSIIDKAVALLGRCNEVTLVSVNADGYPRPVPMAKGHTEGCNEVWVATAADSVKVADFKLNPKAGLCYSCNRDSVSLRGHVEIITDDAVRKAMWQDWYIKHFPGGPEDANYLLLHFTGIEATFWINGEFAHVQL